MPLVSMRQLLDHAAENGYGIPAFNVNNLEQVQAVMTAAAEVGAPVILQASAGARKYAGEPFIKHLIQAAVESWPQIPLVMHQDHGQSPDVCKGAMQLGFSSVMMDGSLEGDGKTVVVVSEGKRPLGLIALRDEPRPDAMEGLARLRALGVAPVMLTGDNARTAAAISAALGIEYKAELLPDAKLEAITAYKSRGPIAMVGDGINDAPALAASSVGIAMGGGTDVALETAEAALLKNRLVGVAELLSLSRATLANIWQNITIALGLKGAVLLTTLFGATPLWMAILADTGATVLVTANALRLLRQAAPTDDLKQ